LTFCVVDPNKVADLRFATIERLASIDSKSRRAVDFLVLIPSFMDARRERTYYLRPSSSALSEFLGDPNWRDDWARTKHRDFGVFVVDAFGRSMLELGYLWEIKDAILVGDGQKELYHLAFFSRHPLGRKFAREARKYATKQLGFRGERGELDLNGSNMLPFESSSRRVGEPGFSPRTSGAAAATGGRRRRRGGDGSASQSAENLRTSAPAASR